MKVQIMAFQKDNNNNKLPELLKGSLENSIDLR